MIWGRALSILIVGIAAYMILSVRLSVSTPGQFAVAPAEWWVLVRVEPHEDDRWLEVIADGAEYRSSGRELAGADAPRIHQIWFSSLSQGCYRFRAEIRNGVRGKVLAHAWAPWPLTVIGPDPGGDTCE